MRKTPTPARSTRRIATFLSSETEHGRSILRGIARFYRGRSEVTVLKFAQSENYEAASLRTLRCDAVIAKVGTARDERVLASLGIPAVNISGQLITEKLSTINTDDERVGQIAMQHLFRRGYRHFAYCGSATHLASRLRLAAYRQEVRRLTKADEAAHPIHTHFLPLGDQVSPYPEPVREKLLAWVRNLNTPSAVFTFTDRVAVEIEEACSALGLRIPEDVAILGVGNDLTRIEFAHVELSSIQLNTEQIGWLAAEQVDRWIGGIPPAAKLILVPPLKIVTRRSTDTYAVADEVVSLALDYIREHLGNPIYVADIARAVGISRRGLEMRFRSALGVSIYQEVQRKQLEFAATLLTEPGFSIGEVAFRAGFSGNAVFSRAFRQWAGHSPTDFRRHHGGGASFAAEKIKRKEMKTGLAV